MAGMKRENKRKEIRKDLMNQLKRNRISTQYYIDLVEKYMDFWDIENDLIDDIRERGVVVTYDNGGGQKGIKKNDSIDQRIKVSAQMLKILDSLGIKPTKSEADDDEL